MRHLDLFSGIGGFALASELVWQDVEHTFVEYDSFCQEVLKKHWPGAEIHGDIRTFIADSQRSRYLHGQSQVEPAVEPQQTQRKSLASISASPVFILTGGFPCQPFSQAGRRKGTADDRYLWPAMFECIALYRPRWVIAENVAGLVTWNDGLVLETVCADLEKEGYEVQSFIIPACAVGEPHRRDRVWIVAHAASAGGRGKSGEVRGAQRRPHDERISERKHTDSDAPDTASERSGTRAIKTQRARQEGKQERSGVDATNAGRGWSENWLEVATRLCRVDDGLPRRMDRASRLKALGNSIVPQVAAEIMRAIRAVDVC